ncbi:MAG: glycosyltransferase [Xanthomonadaceae bacterium]|nr:glycosyltransferase [Xanthomonadaceae bacterium]
MSNTVLEAMACGLPVVATRVGGNAELVAEGKTGFLVRRDDPAAMAAALAGYVHDPELRRDHGAAARQRIEAQFSLDGMVARYINLYDELTGR